MEDKLREAALAVSGAEGDKVYERLAQSLARILEVEFATIAVHVGADRLRLRTLARYWDGEAGEAWEYPIAGTPCEQALGRAFGYYADEVARHFPQDPPLETMGIRGYAASTLTDARGRAIGVVSVMSRRPLGNRGLFETVLAIFAVRISAEIERRAAEAYARAVFDASEDAIFVHDFDTGAILDVNPRACSAYGYSREEFRRMSVGDFSSGEPPCTGEEAARLLAEAKSTGGPLRFEWQRRNKDGSLAWDQVTLKRVDLSGRRYILAITSEITSQKIALERLRASEAQYRAMFDGAADGMVLRDAEFRIVDVNKAYVQMSGNPREEVLGRRSLTFQVPEVQTQVMELHARALAGEHVLFEAPAARRDGRMVQLELRGVPMVHEGRPHVLYVGRDVTERKRAEERLRASEEQYRAIFNATDDAMVLRDADFRIVDVNRAYEKMSGYARDEVVGRDNLTFSDPELRAQRRALHDRALAGEQVFVEVHGRSKEGRDFVVEVRLVPIRYAGKPHVLQIGHEVTARRQAEAERAQLEAQLRQAQKMEAIGHLTGGIAHDFNNILQGILGNLTLAAERQEDLGDPRLGKYLERAHHSAQRARELIGQMLTFSRGQRGPRRRTALPELVKDACKLLRSTLPTTIELRQSLEVDLPPLEIDPVQIEQVVLNLCINARDAMRGAGAIRVGVKPPAHFRAVCASCRQKVEGRYIELFVRDTGPGIPAHVMDRMFEPFFSTKEVGRGSGMGLSLAHGIVHDHGGHILVDSVPHERTKFRVLLAPPEEAIGSACAATDPTMPPVRHRPKLEGRVLVVDDEEAIRDFMTDLLTGWGLSVGVLPDGEAARQAISAAPRAYDLVITDHTMPQRTGLSLAREILRFAPGLPVILYTGYGEDLSPDELRAAGVAQLVRKPIEPAQFFPLIAAQLLRSRNKSAAA